MFENGLSRETRRTTLALLVASFAAMFAAYDPALVKELGVPKSMEAHWTGLGALALFILMIYHCDNFLNDWYRRDLILQSDERKVPGYLLGGDDAMEEARYKSTVLECYDRVSVFSILVLHSALPTALASGALWMLISKWQCW